VSAPAWRYNPAFWPKSDLWSARKRQTVSFWFDDLANAILRGSDVVASWYARKIVHAYRIQSHRRAR
jgi:hypothetical protein